MQAMDFAAWAQHHRFDIESISAVDLGGTEVVVRGVKNTEVRGCYINAEGWKCLTTDGLRAFPDRFAVHKYLLGESVESPTLAQFLQEFENRDVENREAVLGRKLSKKEREHWRSVGRTEALYIILDTLLPELLKLAGRGLPIIGERRISRALGLSEPPRKTPGDKAE